MEEENPKIWSRINRQKMAKLQIELRDVFGYKNFKVMVDQGLLTQELLKKVIQAESKNKPYHVLDECFLYDPHRAVFNLSNSLFQNGIKNGDQLRYYSPTPRAEFENIEILNDFDDEIIVLEENDPINIELDNNIDSQIVVDEQSLPITINVNKSTLSVVQGDITQQKTDAIVNAAKPSLSGGGGVDKSIHDVAGPELVKASRDLAPCRPGEAVITPGFRLMCHWVIHTVGPIYEGGEKNESSTLSSAYRNSLNVALNSNFNSVSFPSISTGYYGYPIQEAADVALHTIVEVLSRSNNSLLVFIVLYNYSDFTAYQNALKRISMENNL